MSDHDEIRRLLEENGWIRSLARSLLADENDADDVVQDVWIVALVRPPRHSNLRRWARLVTRRVISRRWRGATRRARREASVARENGTEAPSTEEIVERTQVQKRLVDAVLELPEPYGESILLRFFEGLSAREIAQRLGVPLETVRARIKRGLERLRSAMDETYRGDRAAWSALLLSAKIGAKHVGTFGLFVGKSISLKPVLLLALAVLIGLGALLARGREPHQPIGEHQLPVSSSAVDRPGPGSRVARAGSDGTRTRRSVSAGRASEPPRCVNASPAIHGTIRDPAGTGVANATVAILASSRRARPEDPTRSELALVAKTHSGEDGSFRFDGETGPVFLVIVADGFGKVQKLVSPGHRVDVVLRKSAHVEGRVTYGDRPVGNALVVLFRDDSIAQLHGFGLRGLPMTHQLEVSYDHRRTDRDGIFRFSSVAKGTYFVSAFSPNRFGRRVRRKVEVLPGTRSLTDIELSACDLSCLRGRVLDAESKQPLRGARIRFDRNPEQVAVSAGDGCYGLEGITGRRVRILVEADGYLSKTQVEIGPNAADVLLSRPGRMTGRVVTREGIPVAGARIRTIRGRRVVRTDSAGGFELSHVRPGPACRLLVEADGFCPETSSPFPVRPGMATDGVTLRLDRGGTVVGAILGLPSGLDPAGHPIALRPQGDGADRVVHDVVLFCTTTDEHARFRLANVTPGEYGATAWVGRAFTPLKGAIRIREGEETEVLLTCPAETAVSGRVVSEDGRPVPFARVAMDPPGGVSAFALTDARGRFALLTDRGPICRLLVHSHGRYFDRRIRARRSDENLIRLARRQPLKGFVVDSTGTPAHAFWIRVFAHDIAHAGVRGRRFFASTDGAFDLAARLDATGPDLLPEGVYDIEAGGSGGQVSAIATNVTYGPGRAPSVLTFRLRAGGSLACRVRDGHGRPPAGAVMGIHLQGTAKALEGRTDHDGRLTFHGLQAGRYDVEAGSEHGNAAGTVHVTEGRASVVRLTLVPGGVLLAQTKNAYGRPLADATVTVAPREGNAWRTRIGRTGPDGTTTFRGLAPGRYRVKAAHPEGVREATVWLPRTERRVVTLEFD